MKKVIQKVASFLKYHRKCKIEFGAIILGQNSFEGHNKISSSTYLKNVDLGLYSYIGFQSLIADASIGRFVSIGDNVVTINSSHPLEPFVSTHPVFYSKNRYHSFVDNDLFNERILKYDKKSIIIGNDVWIGSHVLIKGGVKIGDGAVIAMGSVVVKDVDDYSIVGGVPAKEIRKRFSKEEREKLQTIKWWNKPIDWIKNNSNQFSDIKKFCNEEKR